MIKSHRWAAILLGPGLIGFALFWLWPIVSNIHISMTDYMTDQTFVFLQNYIRLFQNPVFLSAAGNTLALTALLLAVSMVFMLAAAYALCECHWLRPILYWVAAPFFASALSAAFSWQSMFDRQGVIQSFISALGGSVVDWQHSSLAYVPILLFFLWRYAGLGILILYAALRRVPEEYSEAFYLDSRSHWRRIRLVLLPSILPQLCFVLFLFIMYALAVSSDISVTWNGYPPVRLYMLQHYIVNNFRKLNYENSAVASVCILAAAAALFRLVERLEKRSDP